MTTEEKAKAYDKALEMAKNVLETELHESGAWAIQKIFPQLKESEDERMIEQIKFAVMQMPSNREDTKKECLAWLEKQKDSVSNTKYIEDVAHAFEDGRKKGIEEKQKEQKPAEWSEEDSIKSGILSEIIFDYAFHKDALDENQDLTDEYAELDNWLESLPERFSLQPKNEWGEEDGKNLELISNYIYENYPDPVVKYKLKDWLKSLRPQPHWKPSEWQMQALSETIAFAPDTFKPKCTLVTLQNDLKKLMEE